MNRSYQVRVGNRFPVLAWLGLHGTAAIAILQAITRFVAVFYPVPPLAAAGMTAAVRAAPASTKHGRH